MASDVVFCEQLIDAVLTELRAHLPANWSTAAAGEQVLKLLQHGDLADYPAADSVRDDTPAILVRPLGISYSAADSGTGGREGVLHRFRLVHVREFSECYKADGSAEPNMTRARSRYAKIIHKALFADTFGRLDNPTLTSAGSAAVRDVQWEQWDLGEGRLDDVADVRELRTDLWAIAVDFAVTVIAS